MKIKDYIEQAKILKEQAKYENIKILKNISFHDGFYWAVAYTPSGVVSYRLNGATKEAHEKEIKALNILINITQERQKARKP